MTDHNSLWWNIVAAIVVAVFLAVFAIPDTVAVQVAASIYALLLLGVLLSAGTDGWLPHTESRLLVLANVLLFCAAYVTFLQLPNLTKDNAYALALLISFAVSVQLVCAWLVMRSKSLTRGLVGHAAHAVCLRQEDDKLYTFIIYNRNHSLWLLPGGHMDIVYDEPFVVARHRILSELGYESTVLESFHFDKREFANVQILNGCHAFYRISLGLDKCHHVHFDFAYVCLLTKQAVNAETAKYERIRFDVGTCRTANDVSTKLREAVFGYYNEKHVSIPHEPYPPDLADRIYLGVDHYHKHMAQRGREQQ